MFNTLVAIFVAATMKYFSLIFHIFKLQFDATFFWCQNTKEKGKEKTRHKIKTAVIVVAVIGAGTGMLLLGLCIRRKRSLKGNVSWRKLLSFK